MAVSLRVRGITRALPDADVVVSFFDGKNVQLPEAVARTVRDHLRRAEFSAREHDTHVVPLPGRTVRTVFVVGTGAAPTLDVVRRGVAAATQYAKKEGFTNLAALTPDHAVFPVDFDLGRAFAEGVHLANYRFTAYASELAKRERRFRLQRAEIFVPARCVEHVREGIKRGVLEAEGTILARYLVNEPASRVTPAALVEQARKLTNASRGLVELQVLDREQCKQRGMGAFLAVAQGSTVEPAFIHLRYRPKAGNGVQGTGYREGVSAGKGGGIVRVALVGKGITFDSGGLSLKNAEGMETMKIDMAGAAAVLGVFSVLPKLSLPLEVHGMIAACENMPSGAAIKPGDIVRTASGKTVEILNTDAEGRLVLADAFAEAVKVKPQVIVDLATLTGACMVALGEELAGLFCNDESTTRRLQAAASAAGEDVWRLPLVGTYRQHLKSTVADIKNVTGKRWGGAITAALFLREFVGKTPWAHLDIAGPSYAEKPGNPVNPVGGTGFGVRTVLRYLESLANQSLEG